MQKKKEKKIKWGAGIIQKIFLRTPGEVLLATVRSYYYFGSTSRRKPLITPVIDGVASV
jgi:hypothetical protein